MKLGDVLSLRKGLTYKSSHYSNEQAGMIFLTLKSIQRGGGFNTEGVKYYAGDFDKNAVVKEGDLVIANTDITRNAEVVGAPMLLPKHLEEPVLISMDLSVLDIDNDKADNHYLYYLLQTPTARNFMRDHSSGSTVLHLKTKDVPNFGITIPPLSEQKKIAEILSTVDEEIQKTDEIISATEKLKRGLMQKLFTRGIGHTKFKNTEVGEIPAEWNVQTIKESTIQLIDGDRGVNYPKLNEFFDEGHCVFLSAKNVTKEGFVFDEVSFISKEKDAALRKGKLQRGDVILTSRGTVGNIAYFDDRVPFENIRINSGMLIFRGGKDFDPQFMFQYLSGPQMETLYLSMGSGSAQPQLPIRSLEMIRVPIIPIDEQKKISSIIDVVSQKVLVNQKLKDKLSLLKKGLMQDLLSGKKRTI